jgi:hypothetical protein
MFSRLQPIDKGKVPASHQKTLKEHHVSPTRGETQYGVDSSSDVKFVVLARLLAS